MNPLRTVAYYIAGALALALLAFAGVKQAQVWKLTATNATQAARLAKLDADNAALTIENKGCAELVGKQNEAIEQLRAEAEMRARLAAEAVAAADRSAEKHLAAANDLRRRPMPKPGDECGSLDDLLNEEIGRRQNGRGDAP